MANVIRRTSEIAEKPTDDKTRLDALALLNDCYKLKIDLITGGVYVTNAFKSVQAKLDQLSTSKKQQGIPYTEEEEKTTNGVF